MSELSAKNLWDDWENPVPEFDSTTSSISDIMTPIPKDTPPNLPRAAMAGGSQTSLKSKASLDNSFLSRSTSSGAKNPADQLIRLMEVPQKVKALKEVAKKVHMIQYISFYEDQFLIRYLANNVASGMLLTLVKVKLSKLAAQYLINDSPQKLKISDPVLTQTLLAIEKLKVQDSAVSIDVQFLDLLTADAMSNAAAVILPSFDKTPKSNKILQSNLGAPKTKEDSTTDNISHLLDIPAEKDKFITILAKQHCLENIFYYQRYKEAHDYGVTATSPIEKQTLKKMIKQIGKEFISVGSPYELNISSKVRNDFETLSKDANFTISILEPTLKEVLSMLLLNTYPHFHKLEHSIVSISSIIISNAEKKQTSLQRSNTNSSIFRAVKSHSKDNLNVNDSASSLSRESSVASSLLGKSKSSKFESPSDQIAKILDSKGKGSQLRELADKYIMIHYINFYEKLVLLKDLAANGNSPLILSLMKQILKDTQSTYIKDGAPLRLLMFSPATTQDFVEGCKKFHADNPVEEIGLDFLTQVTKETLEIIANALLSKFNSKKSSSTTQSSTLTSVTQNLNKFDETNFDNVKQVLDSPLECEKMVAILAKQHCLENYFYYKQQKEVYAYSATATSPIEKQTLKKMIKDVGRDFLASGAPYELNLPSKIKGDFEESVKSGNVNLSILEPVTKEVMDMLIRNTYPLYLKLK